MAEGNHLNFEQISPKKRVLFVITQSEYGGAQRFLHNLINRLDKNKFEPFLVGGAFSGKEFITEPANGLAIKTFRIQSLRREINLFSDLKAVRELKKIIKELRPDVLFLISSKAGFIGSLALRLAQSKPQTDHSKTKVIYRIGGWSFNDPWPTWKKILFTLLEKTSARWKDIIIVNNQYDLNQAKRYGIKPKKEIILIPNGLDVYKMDFMSKDEARLKLFEKISKYSGKIFQIKTIVGTIANFYPAKGLSYLIETAEYFKNKDDLVFFVIGDGPERPTLEKIIAEKGLEKKIFLLGQIPDAYHFLPAFDIFVLPSIKEGFPWALIEAMAAKLPSIATSVGAIPEIIEDEKNGLLIEPAKPNVMAAAIKEMLSDEIKMREQAIQAHQTVLLKYDLEKMVRQIEDLI